MTINVAVKCPDGIVMGADSLVTLATPDGIVSSIIPYYTKLFPIGPSEKPEKNYAAGAMLNGAGSIGGRTLEDIIQEFGEEYPAKEPIENYSLQRLTEDLGNKIQQIINTIGRGKNPLLEIIVGGYSRGGKASGRRYGEIYSLFWNRNPYQLRVLYMKDSEFGTHYGGQPKILDRFRYGIDEWIIFEMLSKREQLFNNVRDYILDELRTQGLAIPNNISINVPTLSKFDVLSLFSNYKVGKTPEETLMNIKEGISEKLQTMENFFSLQTAVNYCSFLMSCAYAENNFTFVIPSVGSEMRVASITRTEGFKFRKIWEIQTPGPPFR